MLRLARNNIGRTTGRRVLNQLRHTGARQISILSVASVVGSAAVIAPAVFALLQYKVAKPNQYLVKTGLGIGDVGMEVSKTTIHWPLQRLSRIELEPSTYHLMVEAMSQEKIAFRMPAVFTIGPKDDKESLMLYAQMLNEMESEDLSKTIDGIVQGEVRILAASSKLDELFNSREHFKTRITDKINEELRKFGLLVYNGNIEELRDLPGNAYFSVLRERALEGAINKARVDVAGHKRFGDTGEADHIGQTRQRVATVEKEAVVVENERHQDVAQSNALLSIKRAEYDQQVNIAQAESHAAAKQREYELQISVEEMRRKQQVEEKRASCLASASVQAEVDAKYAEGVANALRIKAEAELFAKQQEAEGIYALREAEAKGLERLTNAAGGVDGLTKYLLVRDGTLTEIAHEQAQALQGMNPQITVWSGVGGGKASSISDITSDIIRTAIPLMDGIKNQTGYDLASAFGIKSVDPVNVETKSSFVEGEKRL